ncbi:MAG: serine/threonine-protein kinase [Steroidobacteraceae bacterium]
MEAANKDPHDIARRAREIGPREWRTYVQQQCGDDATLISQVLAILDQGETTAASWQHDIDAEWLPDSMSGLRLGAYRLVRLLGSGGMGEVYLAERIDHEFEQKVAIKLVRGALLSDDIRTRVRTERQILASLQHPNIATLLDGGTAPDGTPYLVMEYIEGVPINVHCDRQQLTLEQRLHLFCKVCAAVQCAHQSLIVHRDLKPNNILVTAEGEPKLLDFGIAKLLDTQIDPRSVAVTHHHFRVMTPAHASPEQVRGDPITTASDIYVLGLLLYELLSGRRAFVLTYNSKLADVERLVCRTSPLPPSVNVARAAQETPGLMYDLAYSRNTSINKLIRRLRGDLDNMVLMALRKRPSRRYASANQFAEDIQHWLRGEPVIASKDSWLYRSRKFVRRHALAVSVTMSTLLLSIAFAVVANLQSQNIARQRDAAIAERNRAERVASFLMELFERADPSHSRGNELKARELLDAGTYRIASQLQSQPAIHATLLSTLGKAYDSLGLCQEAEPLYRAARGIETSAPGTDHVRIAELKNCLQQVLEAQDKHEQAAQIPAKP